nr:PAS domain-containing protein [uncultured Rhodopila sp.]
MSASSKRRGRHRTGSSSTRFTPSLVVPPETVHPAPIGAAGVAASAAVAIVALALMALIWMITSRVIQDQGAEIRERAEQSLAGQAATMAETVSHELQMIDQSLMIIQSAWKQDSDSVDLKRWPQKMPALTAVSDDLFISDENHIVRQDILPQAVGQHVGAAYVTFAHGILESFESDGARLKDSSLVQVNDGAPIDARQFLMYIVRPLDHPRDWQVGASYRSTELTRLFAEAALGFNPVVALIDTLNGNVQALVGPSARRPKTDLSQTPLFATMTRLDSGVWLGPTGIDEVERLHAFHRVADRDLTVIVGANWAEVMTPVANLAAASRILAGVASALVMAVAALVLWELYALRSRRHRERIYKRTKSEIERLRSDEAVNLTRTQLSANRLQALMENASDGVALFDASQRLVQWNHTFARGIGIQLRQELPLDSLLREQFALARPGSGVTDPEAEIARRAIMLLTGNAAGIPLRGPEADPLMLRGLPIELGGLILLLNGFATWHQAPAPEMRVFTDALSASPPPLPPAPAPIEW